MAARTTGEGEGGRGAARTAGQGEGGRRAARTPRLKHEGVVEALSRAIRSGALPRGARLPGEVALAAQYGVSRNTVRQALAELSARGLVATRTGKGSYVVFDGRPPAERPSWSRPVPRPGLRAATAVVRLDLRPDPQLAESLELPDSAEFVVVDRLTTLSGGAAVALERTHVPAAGPLRELPATGLTVPLHEALAEAGLHPDHGEEWTTAAPLTPQEAAVLGRAPGTVFLRSRRVLRTPDARFAAHVDRLLDPSCYHLHTRLPPEP